MRNATRMRPGTTRCFRMLTTGLVLWPAMAFAHEGHGQIDARLVAHYLAEPEHLLWGGLAAIALVGIGGLRGHLARRQTPADRP